jgi:hypothetical protein
MNDQPERAPAGRLQLLLVALIFVVPLGAAVWMYYGGNAPRPASSTNHGALLTPIINLKDELGETPLVAATADHWAMVYVLADATCGAACEDALYRQRQIRLMLGNDMNRVVRVLLHAPGAADTLSLTGEHAGLAAISDPAATRTLANTRPRELAAGGFYLLDPLGNLVMYFPADLSPRELADDLEHLLKLSRIG